MVVDDRTDVPSEHSEYSQVPGASRILLEAFFAENRAAAARLRACHQLHETCADEQFEQMIAAGYDPEVDEERNYAVVDPQEIASSEIVAAYGVHIHRARAILCLALDLVRNFPAIIDAMESGRLDERTAEILAKQMRRVDASVRDAVQKAVVEWLLGALSSGQRPGRSAILAKVDRIIEEYDPEGVLYRRREALKNRYVNVKRSADGMSSLHANLASTDAEAIFGALQAAARERMDAEKEALAEAVDRLGADNVDFVAGRTMDQHRADALVDTFIQPATSSDADGKGNAGADTGSASDSDADTGTGTGTDTDTNGARPGAGNRRPPVRPTRLRPHITVLTGLGPDGEPEVYLPRGGEATIDTLIALLTRSVGATISVPDPETGSTDSPLTSHRYRIGPDMARRIRLRDGTCRHPGCSVPAESCDIDHVRPFDHTSPDSGGLTVESNLMCLCRSHHRLKTFRGWRYKLSRDGTLTVTTDTGHTLTTSPEGPLARWRETTEQRAERIGDEDEWSHFMPGANPPPVRERPVPTRWYQRVRRLLDERQVATEARHAPKTDSAPPPF